MITQKQWWTSTTIQGQLITVAMFFLTIFKINWLSKEEVSFSVGAILGLVGIVIAVYGRIKVGKNPVKLGWTKIKEQ